MNDIYVGNVYNDPEGTWKIIAINNHTVTVEQIQEGNIMFGKECIVTIDEVEYFMRKNIN
jgi:hypothetical protein